jgi:hypothetical protein
MRPFPPVSFDALLSGRRLNFVVGVDYKTKMITRGDKRYKLALWVSMLRWATSNLKAAKDTAGQERFRSVSTASLPLF